MLCSVTCTVFCDMLFHICGVMLCCIYYVTYVILCYICNVMVHALYKMHYVTCFATNITLCCITGADSFMLLHMLRFDTVCNNTLHNLCHTRYVTYVTSVYNVFNTEIYQDIIDLTITTLSVLCVSLMSYAISECMKILKMQRHHICE